MFPTTLGGPRYTQTQLDAELPGAAAAAVPYGRGEDLQGAVAGAKPGLVWSICRFHCWEGETQVTLGMDGLKTSDVEPPLRGKNCEGDGCYILISEICMIYYIIYVMDTVHDSIFSPPIIMILNSNFHFWIGWRYQTAAMLPSRFSPSMSVCSSHFGAHFGPYQGVCIQLEPLLSIIAVLFGQHVRILLLVYCVLTITLTPLSAAYVTFAVHPFLISTYLVPLERSWTILNVHYSACSMYRICIKI